MMSIGRTVKSVPEGGHELEDEGQKAFGWMGGTSDVVVRQHSAVEIISRGLEGND